MFENAFSRVKLLPKIFSLGISVAVCFVVLMGAWVYPQYRQTKYQAKQDQTRNLVLAAYNAIQHYADLAQSGEMSEEEAQQRAMQAVKTMRYENNNYFWINDLEPKMIMHPNYTAEDKPEWYGTDGLVNYADPTGKKLFVEAVKVCQADGQGFVDYHWTKAGQEEEKPVPKISFVKLVPEWGWIVGSGVYVDDVEAEVAPLVRTGLMIVFFIVALAFALSFILARSIAAPIAVVTEGAQRLSAGDAVLQDMDWEKIAAINSRRDELGAIGQAFSQLIEYFKKMTGVAQVIAAGDLTARIKPKSERDLLGNAFVDMISQLHDLLSNVTENSISLGAASGQLSAASEQAGMATAQIATTIQQVAQGVSQQTGLVNETAGSVDQMVRAIEGVAKGAQEQASAVSQSSQVTAQMSSAIQQVAKNAQAGAKGASGAAETAKLGAGIVNQNVEGMENIKAKVRFAASKVENMGKRSDQIGMIVETIGDIAAQTNLLALNAAIEAARAGEHGKGFAVVADEVRKLAERTAEATNEIGQLIEEVLGSVSEAVYAMDESADEVEQGVLQAEKAGDALGSILDAVEDVNRQVNEISAAAVQMEANSREFVASMESVSAIVEQNTAATEEMTAGSSEVSESIENIASISEENSAATQEVSASTEEMSAQGEEVTASAASLAGMAQTLLDLVAQFKLEAGGVDDSFENFVPDQPEEVDANEAVDDEKVVVAY